jgi:adenylate cyclase
LLSSKEVIEKTGISRATLNNYISWGVVPRPDVLPPEPSDGAAPRIGYFPDDVVRRIEEIQRLKKEGWSIGRIRERFAAAAPATMPAGAAVPPSPAAPAATMQAPSRSMPGLSIAETKHPAYMVDDRFEVLWLNDAARSGDWPNLAPLPANAVSRGLFKYLVQGAQARPDPGQAVLCFHVAVAKQRGATLAELSRDMPADELRTLERLYRDVPASGPGLLAQTVVAPAGPSATQPVALYALHFREGVVFLSLPGGAAVQDDSALLVHPEQLLGDARGRRAPALTQVAVLVADLQAAGRLWAELPAEEYFELVDQIWVAIDPICRRHHGTQGRHGGEGMTCYFLPQADSSYLWNALSAAAQMREAMRRLSKEWQLRKAWATELSMNTGIDEGHEWLGTFRSGLKVEWVVLGDAATRAAQIAGIGGSGAIWITRNLAGKLKPQERQRLKFGVRRRSSDGRDVFVNSTFSRVQDLAEIAEAGDAQLAGIGRLAVAQIIDISSETGVADRTPLRPAP